MASFDETMQKELSALREMYEQKCKDYEELYEDNCSLEEEVSELNSVINNTYRVDSEYIDTIIEFTVIPFKEQLKIYYNLHESKDLFSNKLSYEEMLEKQENNVYKLACVLSCFDELYNTLQTVSVSEKNLFCDEIKRKYELPDPDYM